MTTLTNSAMDCDDHYEYDDDDDDKDGDDDDDDDDLTEEGSFSRNQSRGCKST